ncbi:MAG: thioredoxin family protein [Saprospiraceae bacterium]
MRYTNNTNSAITLNSDLAPRALEDHLNLSADQLDLSYSEKFQALHFVQAQIALKGSFQFYPSDYYDPVISFEEPVFQPPAVVTPNAPSRVKQSFLIGLGVCLSLIVIWQCLGREELRQTAPVAYNEPVKEVANFKDMFKKSSARLTTTLVQATEENTVLQNEKTNKPTTVSVDFANLRNTALAKFDLEKTGKALAVENLATLKLVEVPVSPVTKKNSPSTKKNITDTQPYLASATKAPSYANQTYSSSTPTNAVAAESVPRESIALMEQFTNLTERANQEQKLYFLKFGAPWCLPCQLMEESTFQDQNFLELLKRSYLYLNVNVDLFDGISLKQKYRVKSLPTIIVFDQHGRLLEKVEGSTSTTDLTEILEKHRQNKGLAKL